MLFINLPEVDNLIKIFQINIEYIKTLRHILAIPATGATTQSASLLPAVVVPPAPGVVALLPARNLGFRDRHRPTLRTIE